jgi:hypothetical protein
MFGKTNVVYMCIQKHKNILKLFTWFLIFMKFEGILNHVISHNLNHVWIYFLKNHFKKWVFSNKDAIKVL